VWYFSQKDQQLLGYEVHFGPQEEPCQVYLADYRSVDGRMLPHRIEIRNGNERYGVLTISRYQLAAK
jgi:hypothetical protein